MKTSVREFHVVTNDFKVTDPAVKKLLPSVNIPQSCSLEFHNTNNGIANAFRRAAVSEIPVKALKFDTGDLKTDNPFILVDMIQNRIQLMPIKQTASGKFSLYAKNTTGALRDVYSREISRVEGPREEIFNGTFPICTLHPGQFISINNIRVETGYAYQHACHTVAVHSAITPLTEQPYNEFTGEGISSSMSKESAWLWKFDTNGTISPSDIIRATCDNLISRLRSILGILDNISVSNDLYTLVLPNESVTIGNLLNRNILHLYPDIIFCSHFPDSIERKVTLKLRTDDDPNTVISSAIKFSIDTIEEIKVQIPLRG